MRLLVLVALLTCLAGSGALAEQAPATCSWVVARAAQRPAGKKRNHVTGRVVLADAGKAKASVTVSRAYRVPGSTTGVVLEDVGFWEKEVGADGRFDVPVPEPRAQEIFYVWAAAEAYLVSCTVLLVPGGTELEFILVPKAEKRGP